MSLLFVRFDAPAGNTSVSPFSGTPPLSQPLQLVPSFQFALVAPVQVHVSAAAEATRGDKLPTAIVVTNATTAKF